MFLRHLLTAAVLLTCPAQSALAGGSDLALSKSDGGIRAMLGSPIVYTLTVTYVTGTPGSETFRIIETIPDHTSFSSDQSDPGWSCAGPGPGELCVYDVPAGPPPPDVIFAVLVDGAVPPDTTDILNTARILSEMDPDPSNDTATLLTPFGPDLALSKSDGDITAFLGEPIIYTLTVTYITGTPGSETFRIIETIPAHTTFLSDQSDPGWSCSGPGPGELCVYDVLAGPPPPDVVFTVLVDDAVPPDTMDILNTARILSEADPNPSNDTSTTTTPLTVPVELMTFSVD